MIRLKKYNLLQLSQLLMVLVIIILFNISGRGCPKRGKEKKIGSSYEWAGIAAPSSLTATAFSYSEIRLSWQDNSNNEDGFEIERSSVLATDYSLIATTESNITSYLDTSLTPFTIYYYCVRAFNTIGDRSGWSNVASVITVRPEWGAMAAGESHSLALNANGSLWGWGNNQQGQLDPSDNATSFTLPTLLNPDTDWLAIATGYYHTLAIKTDSTLWVWGDNEFSQLGLGDTEFYSLPTPVGTDSDWFIVGGGESHTIALKSNATLWSWGDNTYDQLGLGDPAITPSVSIPTQIGTTSDWLSITTGGRHNIALKTDLTLWAWGWNILGQLGSPYIVNPAIPNKIGSDSDWSKISAGYVHTIALKITGSLWQWGTDEGIVTPIQIGTDTDWSDITAGGLAEEPIIFYHSLAFKSNGTLWAWGTNTYGQLGLGDNSDRTNPTQIGINYNWAAAAAGGYHSIGRTADGVLWVWGRNELAQLGLMNTEDKNIPINLNLPQPTNLIATVITYTQITLSWSDNSGNAEQSGVPMTVGETGFIIESRPASAEDSAYTQIATVGPNIISYPDETVTRGNTYYYRVKTAYPGGESIYSNMAVGITRLWDNKINQILTRRYHSMVWDGQKVIVFGGYDGAYKNDLWWYDPASGTDGAWIQMKVQDAVGSPSARYAHAMVWDGQKVIMFGGTDDSTYFNDLWWYEPLSNTWTQKFTAVTPTVRIGHSMVWDPAEAGRVIMFGGYYSGVFKNDLWWYEPLSNTWTAITPTGDSPSARYAHSMVWDPIGALVIMFGGYYSGVFKNDLWWYDPTSGTTGAWIQKTPVGSPSARQGHSMVWDTVRQRVIMFGGYGNSSPYLYNDLWWYEPVSNTWTQKMTQGAVGSPSARYAYAMVWDGQKVIMFGGEDGVYQNDLWWWW